MEKKEFPTFVTKADPKGLVSAIVAVMGNIDQGKDIVHKGAFTKTLTERKGKIKILDQHRTDSVLRIIGKLMTAREVDKKELPLELREKYPEATGGLEVEIQFLMDTPEGEGAFKRLHAGALDEWSFGYDVVDHDYSKMKVKGTGEITVRNLRAVKLYEISSVIFGMNDATTTTGTKESGEEPTPPAAPAEGNKSISYSAMVERVSNAFREQYTSPNDPYGMWVREVLDDSVIVCVYSGNGGAEHYQVAYTVSATDDITFAPRAEWLEGEYVFATATPDPMNKAGRVQAARNQERIKTMLKLLREMMSDAGMPDSEDMPKDPPADQPKDKQAGSDSQPEAPSTSELEVNNLKQLVELELQQLEIMKG